MAARISNRCSNEAQFSDAESDTGISESHRGDEEINDLHSKEDKFDITADSEAEGYDQLNWRRVFALLLQND
jgi:hypothetical protein